VVAAVPELVPTVIGARAIEYPIDGVSATMASVDSAFLDVLGVRPIFGGFTAADFERRADESELRQTRPVLLSHRAWQALTGGDPHATGQTRVISERSGRVFAFRIAGVLPEDFLFPLELEGGQPDLVTPIVRNAGLDTRREFQVVFRVAPGVDMAAVRARLNGAASVLSSSPPAGPHASHTAQARAQLAFDRVSLEPLREWIGVRHRASSQFLFWSALGLLAVACFNAAGLAAARNIERRNQLLLCRALGASVGDLARLHLVEVGALAVTAAALSVVLAQALLVQTLAVLPESMLLGAPPSIAGRAVLATVLLLFVSVLAVSIWPLFVASRFGLPTLGRHATSGPGALANGRRSSGAVIAIQAACGFVFVIAGVLTTASLGAALSNDAGYERDRMILLEGAVRRYVSLDDARQQLEDSVALLRRMPRVERVAVSTIQSTFLRPATVPMPVVPQGWSREAEHATVRQVSEDFFDVMRIRLIEGRWPEALEWRAESAAAIVSVAAAQAFWPDGRAIGRTLTVEPSKPPRTVIAVIADTRFAGLDVPPTQDVYLPAPISRGRSSLLYHIRTTDSAEAVLPLVVGELSSAGLRVDRATTHARGLFDSIKDRALPAWLFGSLGAGALVILAIGVGGLLAMTSARRTREVGIRLALGSTPSQVVAVMLVEPLTALLDGLLVGALVSWWLVTFLDSQLYAVGSHHPGLWAIAALLIAAVAGGAGAVPAVRAARLNPVVAIRVE
jgi:predicted permease